MTAYTVDTLLAEWTSAVDEGYSQPIIDHGDGAGLEVYTQAFSQYARVSEAIDRTFQWMYILPWSGQSNDPAQGESVATVTLTFTRTKLNNIPFLLLPGEVWIEENQVDWGELGGSAELTGRRYTPIEAILMLPGTNTATGVFRAEKAGYGFNNPLPGSINYIDQPGSGFANDRAWVQTTPTVDALVADNRADTIIPGHVGQYVRLLTGANAGAIKRIAGYVKPDATATPPNGGKALLDPLVTYQGAVVGTFAVGEVVTQAATGADGIVVAATTTLLLLRRTTPGFNISALTGALSLAIMTPAAILNPPGDMVAEPPVPSPPVSWKIVSWVTDFGLTVTHALSPVGGRIGFLDALGEERNIPRAPGEHDDSYRKRVSQVADVVSPNALRRAANRILSPFGLQGCLREVGLSLFPGFFYDSAPLPEVPYFFDLDCMACTPAGLITPFSYDGVPVRVTDATGIPTFARGYYAGNVGGITHFFGRQGLAANWNKLVVPGMRIIVDQAKAPGFVGELFIGVITLNGPRPQDRYRLVMDYTEFRAFFLMGVASMQLGEFGFAFDSSPYGFFDAKPFLDFYDGMPATAAIIYRSIWQSLYKVKAGGVGFDLVREDIGCV